MLGGPSRRRQRRRIIGSGGGVVALAVDVITRSTLVWVVCIQGSSWRLCNNNNGDASTTTTTTATTSFLVVEGVTFFRPLSVLSSVFMGERPRTLPSVASAASVAQAAKTEPDTTKHEDGVDLQQQAAQTEDKEAEDEHPSPAAADDDMHKEIVDNNNSNNTSDRSNSAAGDSRENEEEEEESSWFHDLEFEDYNAATATLAGETTSNTALDDCQLHPMLQIPLAVSLNDLDSHHNNNNHNNHHHPNNIRAIRAYCDSGATRTVMSYESARRLGWLTQLDRRYAGQATSVGGSCRVLGRLPAGLVNFHLHHNVNNNNNKRDNNNSDNDDESDGDSRMIALQSPTITVLEDLPSSSSTTCEDDDDDDDDGNGGGFELLLGLDFLREYQAILDLRNEELRLLVKRKEYSIPFLRPRSSVSSSSSSTSTSCDATHHDDRTIQDDVREQQETPTSSSTISEHRGRSPFKDDNDHDDDDDYEDFDETLDMSGV